MKSPAEILALVVAAHASLKELRKLEDNDQVANIILTTIIGVLGWVQEKEISKDMEDLLNRLHITGKALIINQPSNDSVN